MSRAASNRGFTLVEVLVAMAIFALLVSVLYGSLNSVTQAYDAAEQAVDDGARMRIGIEFISRIVESAYPVALADRRDWLAQFDGDSDFFVTVADGSGMMVVNEGGQRHGQLKLRLRGTRSNRSGLGTLVEIRSGSFRLSRTVSQFPIEIGIADLTQFDSVKTVWPNGIVKNDVCSPFSILLDWRVH